RGVWVPAFAGTTAESHCFPSSVSRDDGGSPHQLRRPRSIELLTGAILGVAVKIALCIAGNARHAVGLQTRCAISILPEPVFLPALVHFGMCIVMRQPQAMGAQERVFVVTQSDFNELAAIDDGFAAELLVYEFQELARLIKGHGVVAGPLEVERHQR